MNGYEYEDFAATIDRTEDQLKLVVDVAVRIYSVGNQVPRELILFAMVSVVSEIVDHMAQKPCCIDTTKEVERMRDDMFEMTLSCNDIKRKLIAEAKKVVDLGLENEQDEGLDGETPSL